MPVEREEAAKGVRAGAATVCVAAGWKPALRGGGGGRGCPQVANLRLRRGRKEVAGGARRLKTCATRRRGQGRPGGRAASLDGEPPAQPHLGCGSAGPSPPGPWMARRACIQNFW